MEYKTKSSRFIHMQTNPTAFSRCMQAQLPTCHPKEVHWETLSSLPWRMVLSTSMPCTPFSRWSAGYANKVCTKRLCTNCDKDTSSCILIPLYHLLQQPARMKPPHTTWRKPICGTMEHKVLQALSWMNQRISHTQVPNILDWVPCWILALRRPIIILLRFKSSCQDF